MNPNRMAIASSLSGNAPAGQSPDGKVVESMAHEKSEEQMMVEILATVKDIQQKVGALIGSEQGENVPQAGPQGQMPPTVPGQ